MTPIVSNVQPLATEQVILGSGRGRTQKRPWVLYSTLVAIGLACGIGAGIGIGYGAFHSSSGAPPPPPGGVSPVNVSGGQG